MFDKKLPERGRLGLIFGAAAVGIGGFAAVALLAPAALGATASIATGVTMLCAGLARKKNKRDAPRN
jgi:hypothetical protein